MTDVQPRRADARRNRDVLIARAREIFDAGDEHLRFDDFASIAGLGTGTLYRHFPTREALAAAVYQQEVATLCNVAGRLQATLPPGESLAAFLHHMVEHIDAHQRLARRLAALLAAAPDDMVRTSQDLENAVAELFSVAVANSAIRGDVPAGTVMMALHGISAAHDRPNWRAEADGVITVVLEGLRPGSDGRAQHQR
jgi:AcrR family transcriptional regulator